SILTVLGLRRFQELMFAHPAPIVPNAGETAEQFAQRMADYTVAYKSASLEVYTTGFLIALLVSVVGIAFALWLRRNPDSEVETGPIF
ncbi:MAG TPA: hypothetical protein VGE04_09035, partial [Chloroflexia bacterium]